MPAVSELAELAAVYPQATGIWQAESCVHFVRLPPRLAATLPPLFPVDTKPLEIQSAKGHHSCCRREGKADRGTKEAGALPHPRRAGPGGHGRGLSRC